MKKSKPSIETKCKNCKRETELHSGIKNNVLYKDLCLRCIGTLGSSEFYRQWDRQNQRRTFAKDIVQPGDDDYAKIYGADKARERGWTEDELRKYG